jgi:putative membrane protein
LILRWLLASVHLLALPIGLGSVVVRSAALRGPLDEAGIRRVFRADSLWGLSALLWISTGLARVFGSFEKGVEYYATSAAFWHKMGLLLAILLLEIVPMVALIGWRTSRRAGKPIDTTRAPVLARISAVQAVIIVLMVFVASAMARGLLY